MKNKKFLTISMIPLISSILIGCQNNNEIKNISELDEVGTNLVVGVSDEIDVQGKDFSEESKELLAKQEAKKEFTCEDACKIVSEKFKDLLSKNAEFCMFQEPRIDENGTKYYEGLLDKRCIRVYADGKVYNAIGEWKPDNGV